MLLYARKWANLVPMSIEIVHLQVYYYKYTDICILKNILNEINLKYTIILVRVYKSILT